MQKRNLVLASVMGLFLISFVSAYTGGFSFTDFLDSMDPATAVLGALWVIFYLFVNKALLRFFLIFSRHKSLKSNSGNW